MFKPINKHLVVKVVEIVTVLDSGIIVPDSAKEAIEDGVVIHEVVASDSDLAKKGDLVAYANWAGVKHKENDVEYKVLREADLYGVKNAGN